ncbi:MAG TPA: family 43 glycosylhydrolase [Fibrobacteria bacterium]|nr:family 43 glycosylhydrolase [Fibrobacteria bacterium]HOX50866.1 family 43 glycosylhydrolase [Fibrobacteria bacterium]
MNGPRTCQWSRTQSWIASFLFTAAIALAAPKTVNNDRFWMDTSGKPIYSQGGGVYKFGDTWYWYGVHYAGAETYAASPGKPNSDTRFVSVTCYSSKDLVDWKFEGDVLDSNATGMSGTIWFGRMGVAYNKNTGKYVMLGQDSGAAAGSGELFATSSSPTGKFVVDHVQATLPNVVNNTSGDQTVFLDDDGKAYLICSSSRGRAYIYVAPLREADYLAVEPAVQIAKTPGREGNCMFKHRGRYYVASSDLHGWNASHTYLQSATDILGPYGTEFVMGNTDMDFSHVSQTGFFFRVDGSEDTTVVYAGDRWSDFAGNGLGYSQWMPLSFSGDVPSMNSLSEWTLDAVTGRWAVGEGNNWVLNPSFEADRVSQTTLAGWTDSTDRPVFPGGNILGGHTGRWALNLYDSVDYVARKSQAITNIPNGTYTLSAWFRSSGKQKSLAVYARTPDGTEYPLNASGTISDWKQLSLSGIAIADGKVEVGVRTVSNARNWARIDDLVLVKQGVDQTGSRPAHASVREGRIRFAGESFVVEKGEAVEIFELSGRSAGRMDGDGIRRTLRQAGFGGSVYFVRP